jgi:hypothetical protein
VEAAGDFAGLSDEEAAQLLLTRLQEQPGTRKLLVVSSQRCGSWAGGGCREPRAGICCNWSKVSSVPCPHAMLSSAFAALVFQAEPQRTVGALPRGCQCASGPDCCVRPAAHAGRRVHQAG